MSGVAAQIVARVGESAAAHVDDLAAVASLLEVMGFESGLFMTDLLRADALARNGDWIQSLTVIDRGLERVATTGVRYLEAELQRLRGEALAGCTASGSPDSEAELCIRRAIEIAQQQGARWWELRARTSLVSLLGGTPAAAAAQRELRVLMQSMGESRSTIDAAETAELVHES